MKLFTERLSRCQGRYKNRCGGDVLVLRVQLCLTFMNVSHLQRKIWEHQDTTLYNAIFFFESKQACLFLYLKVASFEALRISKGSYIYSKLHIKPIYNFGKFYS